MQAEMAGPVPNAEQGPTEPLIHENHRGNHWGQRRHLWPSTA